ncbi:MAG: MFS transporter [Pseudomonadales bacterium]
MSRSIGTREIWTWGSLGLPLAMLGYPLGIWLPRAYGTDVGIELAWIGFAGMAAGVFDAFTDPIMGFASDRFRSRWGRRRIWILCGTPVLVLAVWMLLNPPGGITAAYLLTWYMCLRVGTTLMLIPYSAWGAELSAEYHTRTRIQAAREVFVLVGLIAAASIPFLVEEIYGDATTALIVLENFSWAVLVLLPLSAIVIVASVPEPPPLPGEGAVGLVRSLRLMARNGLFRRVLAIELLITCGENFRNALSLFFMQEVIGAARPGALYLLYFSTGLIAIAFWNYLARRFGKHQSLAFALVLVGIDSLIIFTLDYGDVTAFYVLFVIKGFCFGAFAYLPRAMLADVIDLDTARSGDSRPGSYFSVHGLMTKLSASVGLTALPLLSMFGFDAGRGASNTDAALFWLAVLYAIVPTLLFALAIWQSVTWPLTAERHARLQGLMERRSARRRPARSHAATAADRGELLPP